MHPLNRLHAPLSAACGAAVCLWGASHSAPSAAEPPAAVSSVEEETPKPADATQVAPARVAELVRQLNSATRREREQAERELLELGSDVLALLPTTTAADAPAIRDALARIRNTLEQRAAISASEASRITLTGKFTLEQICEAIRQQSGNEFVAESGSNAEPITIAWTNRPLWEAIADLQPQGMDLDFQPRRCVLAWRPATSPPAQPMVSSSGPFRVEVLRVTTKPNFIRPKERILQIRWRLNLEPRLRPLYAIIADRENAATDDGRSYEPLSPDARRELPIDRWTGCEVDSSFQIPEGATPGDVEFSAAGTIKLAALPLPLTFTDLDRRKTGIRRRGGVTAILRRIDRDEPAGLLRLKLVVSYDRGGPEFESHRLWIHQNAAWLLLDERQAPLAPARADLDSTDPHGGTLSYEFENVPDSLTDASFVYEAPSLVTEVSFQVSDIPLVIEPDEQAR